MADKTASTVSSDFKYPELFKRYLANDDGKLFQLRGNAWLRNLDSETRMVFSSIGLMALRAKCPNFQSLGGQARVKTAQRDVRGRLLPKANESKEIENNGN